MSLEGVYYDSSLINEDRIKALSTDHIDQHPPSHKTLMVKPLEDGDAWLKIDETYPEQIKERFRLLSSHLDWVIARQEGEDVKHSEIELLNKVVDYLTTRHPEDFQRNGDVVECTLTGFGVDIQKADPLVALSLLATEDFVLMVPSETNEQDLTVYRLKTGALLFPNGWGLTSKFNKAAPNPTDDKAVKTWMEERKESKDAARLGRSVREIHNPHVPEYMKNFENPVDKFFARMPKDKFFWRRNWTPSTTDQLFRHSDGYFPPSPKLTEAFWHAAGRFRTEHQSFVKLPESGTIVFGIKTYIWSMQDIAKRPAFVEALKVALDNISEEMFEYRKNALPSFKAAVDKIQANNIIKMDL